MNKNGVFMKNNEKNGAKEDVIVTMGQQTRQGLPRAGNTNMPGWQSTYAYKFTHKILFEKGRHRTLKQNVDVFGTSQCSPNNSLRRPPRN